MTWQDDEYVDKYKHIKIGRFRFEDARTELKASVPMLNNYKDVQQVMSALCHIEDALNDLFITDD